MFCFSAPRPLLVVLALALPACSLPAQPGPAGEVSGPPGVVYVLDGSGNLRKIAPPLTKALAAAHSPLRVEEVPWGHGSGRIFADLWSRQRQLNSGDELACTIRAFRAAHPGEKVYLVCHSSGAAVGLAAAEHLPPCAIDRLVLLAPAVSYRYDLRPALRCSRDGIDVFYSRKDLVSYSLALVGTADGSHQLPGGCTRFSLEWCVAEEDRELYAKKLRQRSWDVGMFKSGCVGGHFSWLHSRVLYDQVVPLLVGCDH